MLVILQRAFLEHEIKTDRLVLEERRQAEGLMRQNRRIIAILDGYKEKSLDERLLLENQVEGLKDKVEKCKNHNTIIPL